MNLNLARTTTYLDKDLLLMAKMDAIKNGGSVYGVLNDWLWKGANGVALDQKVPVTGNKFDEVVKTKPLKFRGKLDRAQIYDWL